MKTTTGNLKRKLKKEKKTNHYLACRNDGAVPLYNLIEDKP